MKTILTFFFSLLIAFGINAQTGYYFNTINPAGQNPGNLNNDPEQPLGFTPGYTTISAANVTALGWSANQTIPFTFNFNGSAVTSYKVSNSGVLTFTTSATTVPSFVNATIPNTSIPDNSIMIWGIQQLAGNDAIGSQTYGTAPNRQHWIKFLSFSAPGATGSQWTYWSIVLEETSNKIYIVDERTFNTPLSLTLGVQVNSTTAYQITGAPSTPSFVTNGGNASNATDNVYYEFIPGSRPVNDAEMVSLGLNPTETSPVAITGSVRNSGSATLNSVIVNWRVGGTTTINRDTLTFSLPALASSSFSHNINWVATAGQLYDIDVWTSMPNGVADQNNLNDSLSAQVFINTGNTVQKKALLEQFTTAVCQFCPDGAWVADQIHNNYQNVYATSVHSCFGTDAMTNAEASQLCSAIGVNAAPTAMVDRKLFNGETGVAFGRGSGYPNWTASTWATRSLAQSTSGAPVDVNVYGSFNPTTRVLNANVDASFVDYVLPGDIRVSLLLIEDSVVGPNSQGFNQVNAYNGQAGHPYAGRGNPIVGYTHKRVLRDILPSTWGDATVIPTNIALNTNYSGTFTATLPTAFNTSNMYLIGIVNYYGGANIDDYEVLNAKRIRLNLITSIDEVKDQLNSFNIYPNPTNLPFTNVEFELSENSRIEATVYDLAGKRVGFQDFGVMSTGNQRIQIETANLRNGFYMVNFKVGNQQLTKKISILK